MANNKNNQEGRSAQQSSAQNQTGRSGAQQSSAQNQTGRSSQQQNQEARNQQSQQSNRAMTAEEAGHLGGTAPHTCRGFQCQQEDKE